jgi:hypothetical protein
MKQKKETARPLPGGIAAGGKKNRLRGNPSASARLAPHHPPVISNPARFEYFKDILASYRLGASSYLRKPVEFHRFADALKQLGLYWLLLNEAPPRKPQSRDPKGFWFCLAISSSRIESIQAYAAPTKPLGSVLFEELILCPHPCAS